MLEQPFAMLDDYVIRVYDSLQSIEEAAWRTLIAHCPDPSPFVNYAYLDALHQSGSATPDTGWSGHYITLWRAVHASTGSETLVGACALYIKTHSYGEYVFDWSWAQAYERHGLAYYPKALIAVPFTPVPGARLLAIDASARHALMKAVLTWCQHKGLSSLHMLFVSEEDQAAAVANGLMLRHTVQFHWHNSTRTAPGVAQIRRFHDFEDFLGVLNQEKRKKIRQERRKVSTAGVTVRSVEGEHMSAREWDFFYRCYTQTYQEHGNSPYLSRDFFDRLALSMAKNWVLFIAEREGRAIGCSLVGLCDSAANDQNGAAEQNKVAYGRYWGALERVDCLHFELCYYAPIEWCIAQAIDRFEGGAQGEHKMARALMPVKTSSAHWLAMPAFAKAVDRFLHEEKTGIDEYLAHLSQRSPIKDT